MFSLICQYPAPPGAHPGETQERDVHWSAPELRACGWTEAMVHHFLGEPDHRVVNPYYRTAAQMRLYRVARVLAAEESQEFVARAAKAATRSARGKAIAEQKAQALLEQVAVMPVSVRSLAPEVLQRSAIANYNDRQRRRALERLEYVEPASATSDAAFLGRITVNYVRHRLMAYDRRLEAVAGRIGVARAIALIRQRVYAAIAEAYPHLAQECARQVARRVGDEPGDAARSVAIGFQGGSECAVEPRDD